MKITIIDYQPNALDILLYTKNTRLQGITSFEELSRWPIEKKLEELAYMKDTIKSSWEFVSYTFKIEEVTRAFTHQLVRTRSSSYAQESFRSCDVRDNGWLTPEFDDYFAQDKFNACIDHSIKEYVELLEKHEMPIQDARGVLPTNMFTQIIAKFDLRTLSHMAETRLCTRTQGEYQDVFREMRKQIIAIHPWAEDFLNVYCVSYGICCFPRYKDCPIQKHTVQISQCLKDSIKKEWMYNRHEAVVKATNGRSM